MASVLAYIELRDGRPTTGSLEALGEARRITSGLGATLYAMAATSLQPGTGYDMLVATLGQHGADKVVLMTADPFEAMVSWNVHGVALHEVCAQLSPLLVVMSASAGGRDIGARLAARLSAVFVPEPSIETGSRGEFVLTRAVFGAQFRRRLPSDDLGRTVVTTLTPGSYTIARGLDDAELMVLPAPEPIVGIEAISTEADPSAALATARVVVTAGGGIKTAEDYALVAELAEVMNAQLAATRALCRRGFAPEDREVGIGARSIRPRLYVVCAASGSSAHLGAVSADAEIVAINSDPDAPIFEVATYGLVGNVADVVPELIAAIRNRSPIAATS